MLLCVLGWQRTLMWNDVDFLWRQSFSVGVPRQFLDTFGWRGPSQWSYQKISNLNFMVLLTSSDPIRPPRKAWGSTVCSQKRSHFETAARTFEQWSSRFSSNSARWPDLAILRLGHEKETYIFVLTYRDNNHKHISILWQIRTCPAIIQWSNIDIQNSSQSKIHQMYEKGRWW